MDPRASIDSLGYDISVFSLQQPPPIFGSYHPDGSPMSLSQGNYYGDPNDLGYDENDPKRRRIAKVWESPDVNFGNSI